MRRWPRNSHLTRARVWGGVHRLEEAMSETSKRLPEGDIVTDMPALSIDDLRGLCGLSLDQVQAYVAEGIVVPLGSGPEHWRFSRLSVITVRRAHRLERDLGLNPAGVALALELMVEVETLRQRLARYEPDH